ncbi:MAG: hypothetical protein J6M60_04255 [Clostridia bacterium]|nr:hypothetical protein [Clostridia bacterium]
MNKKFFSIVAITVLIIMTITGIIYFVNAKKNEGSLKEKVENELDIIGKELINMANSLNNISFNNYSLQVRKENTSKEENKDKEKSSDEKESEKEEVKTSFSSEETGILNTDFNNIDWDYLKNHSEKLYNIWTTSIIDLNSLNVNSEDILNFSNVLDLTTLSSKNEDKNALLNNIASLYSYIPNFLTQIESDNKKVQIVNTINSVLNSYVFINQNNWNDAKSNTESAINSYMQIINNVDENSKYSKNKITRIYVLLNELNNSVTLNDKEIYFIKYRNVIEELINL